MIGDGIQSDIVQLSPVHSVERTDDCKPVFHTLARFQIGTELDCVDPRGWQKMRNIQTRHKKGL